MKMIHESNNLDMKHSSAAFFEAIPSVNETHDSEVTLRTYIHKYIHTYINTYIISIQNQICLNTYIYSATEVDNTMYVMMKSLSERTSIQARFEPLVKKLSEHLSSMIRKSPSGRSLPNDNLVKCTSW